MPTPSCRSIRRAPATLIAIASLATAYDAMGQQSAAQQPAQETVTAVLKMQESDFVYRTTRNPLTCDELRNGVAVILSAVGARDDVQVRLTNCMGGDVPDLSVSDGSQTWDNNWDRSTRQQSPMERMRGTTARQNTPVHIYAMMPVAATNEDRKGNGAGQGAPRARLARHRQHERSAERSDPVHRHSPASNVVEGHDQAATRALRAARADDLRRVSRSRSACSAQEACPAIRSQRSSFAPEVTVEALLPVGYVLPTIQKEKKEKKEPDPAPAPEPAEQPPPQQ